jgi:hypothetical protein
MSRKERIKLQKSFSVRMIRKNKTIRCSILETWTKFLKSANSFLTWTKFNSIRNSIFKMFKEYKWWLPKLIPLRAWDQSALMTQSSFSILKMPSTLFLCLMYSSTLSCSHRMFLISGYRKEQIWNKFMISANSKLIIVKWT